MLKKIIALITDFGYKDYFVGILKGVIKKIDPEIEIIDISHELPSYNILSASFTIEKAYQYFEPGTVFLVVVDPGVGTERKILIVSLNGYFFIAPDNGVLTPILKRKDKMTRVVKSNRYFLDKESSTFEARDKMAPIAAYLLKGVDLNEISRETSEYVIKEEYFPEKDLNSIKGRVVYIDKFGNIITNVSKEFLFSYLYSTKLKKFKIKISGKNIEKYCQIYEDGTSEPFMLIGSHNNLEIAMNQASAADFLRVNLNESVTIYFF